MSPRYIVFAGLACLSVSLTTNRLQAGLVNWTINQAASTVTLAFPPPQTVLLGTSTTNLRFVNQTASGAATGSSWTTGNTAQVSGYIATDYSDGASIKFLTGASSIAGVAGTTAFQNPANFVQGPELQRRTRLVYRNQRRIRPCGFQHLRADASQSERTGRFHCRTSVWTLTVHCWHSAELISPPIARQWAFRPVRPHSTSQALFSPTFLASTECCKIFPARERWQRLADGKRHRDRSTNARTYFSHFRANCNQLGKPNAQRHSDGDDSGHGHDSRARHGYPGAHMGWQP